MQVISTFPTAFATLSCCTSMKVKDSSLYHRGYLSGDFAVPRAARTTGESCLVEVPSHVAVHFRANHSGDCSDSLKYQQSSWCGRSSDPSASCTDVGRNAPERIENVRCERSRCWYYYRGLGYPAMLYDLKHMSGGGRGLEGIRHQSRDALVCT